MIGIKYVNFFEVERLFQAVFNYLLNRCYSKPSRKTPVYTLKEVIDWYSRITNGKYSMYDVLTATPDDFEDIINEVNKYSKGRNVFKKPKIGPFPLDYAIADFMVNSVYDAFTSAGNVGFIKSGYTAIDLVDALSLKVCPYCNRNFIDSTIMSKTGAVRRTAQLDHFYPKDKHPYLCMSFYNLVPSCANCNKIKSVSDISLNPYTIKHSDDYLKFDIAFNGSLSKLKIVPQFSAGKEIEENWNVLGLDELYKNHNDFAQQLIGRIYMYNKSRNIGLSSYTAKIGSKLGIPGLTTSELNNMMFGYHTEEDLSKQPLSKLTKDLVEKYKK